MGERFDPMLRDVLKYEPDEVAAIRKRYGDKDDLTIAQEVPAHMAETGEKRPWLNIIIGRIGHWMKQMARRH